MTLELRKLAGVAMLVAGAMFATNGGATAADPDVMEWKFRVYLDDKEIGFHDYRISERGGSRRVETEASFDVKFLFFNAYRYRHRNVETWESDCLTGIESSTDANGKAIEVRGADRAEGFVVRAGEATEELPGCVRSFAYWNPALLEASRLLNPQTGEFERVEFTRAGSDTLDVAGESVAASRYEILVKGRTITVWYGDDGRWLALESPAKGGRKIRYEAISLPAVPLQAAAKAAAEDGNES